MGVRILAAVLVFVHTNGLVLSAGEASMTNGAWWNQQFVLSAFTSVQNNDDTNVT